MYVTKRNGRVVVYDTEKIVKSILKANVDSQDEELSRHMASYIADEVLEKLTGEKEMITTQDIRECVYSKLWGMNLPHTAEQYMKYEKNKASK